uniref:Uncharacterized protein n=1 Tax=Anguilla anguilla TaxID=7936 RepID=A0A0E9TTQ9_ANGAN
MKDRGKYPETIKTTTQSKPSKPLNTELQTKLC